MYATLMTEADIAARIERLVSLSAGFHEEVVTLAQRRLDPSLRKEAQDYLAAIRSAQNDVDRAWIALLKPVAGIPRAEFACRLRRGTRRITQIVFSESRHRLHRALPGCPDCRPGQTGRRNALTNADTDKSGRSITRFRASPRHSSKAGPTSASAGPRPQGKIGTLAWTMRSRSSWTGIISSRVPARSTQIH
jgi:hypothetical protein